MKTMTTAEVREAIRRQVNIVGGQSILARSWGISAQYLTDILKGRREPGEKVLRHLGMIRETKYVSRTAPKPRRTGAVAPRVSKP